MPVIEIKIIVDTATPVSKHLLNQIEFDVYQTKEEDNTFAMVQKHEKIIKEK